MALTTTEATQIKKLLAGMFNLSPSSAIYDDIVQSYEATGKDLSLLATNLSISGVFQNQIANLDDAGKANKLMVSLGLRDGTVAGDAAYDYFMARLAHGVTLDQINVEAITYLADDTKRSIHFNDTVTLLDNKAAVADAFIASGIVASTAAELDFISAVTADASTVDIVTNLVEMAAESPTALAEVLNTLVAVKELIETNVDDATASAAVLADLAVVIENVAASSANGSVANLATTLSAVTATVEAAKEDASFVANPETLATSIAANPTAVEEDAAAVVEEATTPTTPSTGGGGGGSSTPAPTFTASVDENGTITFSGTATGNITMNGGDSSEGDTQDVTFTRGGVTTSTVTLDTDSEISVASGQTYVITAAQANEAVIEGEGTVNITNLEDTLDVDLSGIDEATTVTVTVAEDIEISADAVLGRAWFLVNTGVTLTLSAAQAHDRETSGEGNTTITASDSGDEIYVLTEGTNSITAGLGLDIIELGYDGTDYTGTDTVVVGAADAGIAEVQEVTLTGTLQADDEYTLTLADGSTTISSGVLADTVGDSNGVDAANLAAALNSAVTTEGVTISEDSGNIVVTYSSTGAVAGTIALEQTVVAGNAVTAVDVTGVGAEATPGVDAVASDSPFATPDTITNFTPNTDKLQIASSTAVATGTGGIIGDNSANTDDVAIGSTGTSIDFGTVTNGVIVFSDDADTPAEITIDSSDAMTAALTYLSANISDGDTVAFDYNIDSVSGTIVFQGDAGGDIAVNLIGVSASSLGADLDLVTPD